jgi:hypothetical protein
MNIQCSVQDLLSFQRIVDIPFGTCVAALESWQLTGQDGGHRTGLSLLCGPIEHDRDSGTHRIQVRMARGPLRRLLRMRLDIDRWSSSPLQTALELTPCRYVRPSTAYFRAGHFMLDSLVLSLAQYGPTDGPPQGSSTARAVAGAGALVPFSTLIPHPSVLR